MAAEQEKFSSGQAAPAQLAGAASAWRVCFAPKKGERAGRELPLGKAFEWAGRRWRVPAAYLCGKGLVLDILIEVPAERLRAFIERWKLGPDSDYDNFDAEQHLLIENDNPFSFDFTPTLFLNGKELPCKHGRGRCWDPLYPEQNDEEARAALAHYALDPASGWMLWRYAFPWKTKRRPQLRELSLRLAAEPQSLPGPHFAPRAPGDTLAFTDPVTGSPHTLTVRSFAPQCIEENPAFQHNEYIYPPHFMAMGYTVSPALPPQRLCIQDCADGDRPRRREAPCTPDASASRLIAILGGAHGMAAVGKADEPEQYAASSLHFEPVERVEWRLVFRTVPCAETVKALL